MQNRRNFLKHTMALPLMLGGGSMLGSLAGIQAQAADTSGYRALVCVFLFGGMDCHDTVLPYDPNSYNQLLDARRTLFDAYAALPGGSSRARERLLPLSGSGGGVGNRQFALPPEMAGLHGLFEQGSAAIVGNVGPLLSPTNRDSFFSDPRGLPARLFSHNDQQSTWMSFEPEGALYGWGGRFGDALVSANSNNVFSQVSLFGNTIFLAGDTVKPFQASTSGVPSIGLVEETPDSVSGLIRDHFASAGQTRGNLFERDYVDISRISLDANDELDAALLSGASISTTFPGTSLGQQLRAVAQAISIRESLGAGRQVFFVGMGGFDTHSAQANELPELQQTLSEAVTAFYTATQELGVSNQVTTFSAADFGRTLTANGDGTDHGWGGHHFVIGDAVRGGRIYGDIPESTLGHQQDAGNGRLIPTTSVEQFAAPLGRWFGLNDSELQVALPGLANFPGSGIDFIQA